MKKNYFILQMLVLLALLVPWTAWGQGEGRIVPQNTPRYESWYIRGEISVELDANGKIPNDNRKNYKEIDLSDFTPGWEYSLWGWDFSKENYNRAIIKPANSDVTATVHNNNNSIHISGTPTETEIYVRIHREEIGDDGNGWVKITFTKKEPIDVSNSLEISYSSGKGEKVYDGQNISDEELKDGLIVQAGETTFSSDEYAVEIVDNGKDVGAYTIKVTITKEGYKGVNDKTKFTIKQRPITITLKEDAKLEFTVGDETPTFAAEEYLTVAAGTDANSGLVKNEEPKFTGALAIEGFSTEKTGEFSIKQGTAAIESSETFDEKNYQVTWDEFKDKVTVEAIKVDPENIKITFDGANAGDAEFTYDGKGHGISTVTINGKALNSSDYTVTYTANNEPLKEGEEPTHVLGNNQNPEAYVATVTLNQDKYDNSAKANAKVTIKPATLTISATKGDEIAIIWDKGNMVTAADAYLSVSGFVNQNESATIKGELDINPDDKGNYIIKKGTAEVDYSENKAQKNDYIENWGNLAADQDGITAGKGEAPVINEGETITIASEGEEGISLTEENATRTYDGKTYKVTELGDVDLSTIDNEKITVTYNGEPQENGEIKNAGTYEIYVEYKDAEGNTHKGTFTLTITKATLTVTVLPQPITVTDLSNTFVEDNTKNGLMTDVVVDADESKSTIRIEGAQNNEVIQFVEGSTLSLTTPAGGTWVVGKNASTITAKTSVGELDKTLQLAEPFATNYTLILNPGDLTINYQITDENKDKVVINFEGLAEGNTKTYDGQPIEVASVSVNGVTLEEGYTVTFKDEDGNEIEDPTNAGTYTATVTFKEGSNYSIAEGVAVSATCSITKRTMNLTFEFKDPIDAGKVPTLDDAAISITGDGLAEYEYLTDCIDVTFKLSENLNGNNKYDVYIDKISIKASEDLDNAFNPANYQISIICNEEVSVELTDTNNDGTYEGSESDFNDKPVGEIDVIIDSTTGESSSGITYKRYELKLANKDFYPVNCREDYAAEGIELLSRHDKKTTWEGGSFTVYYKHNGVENDGEYRVFIRRGDHGDKWEEITQDITGYYQIRNVTSNIYVKLYYGTGFPVANEEITATDARAYSQANKIVVITPEPTDVQIISMAGAVVATDQVTGQREFANLMEGIYIVRMGDTVVKLQVRN